jgi:GNAT superfamily N-acetyltransferase
MVAALDMPDPARTRRTVSDQRRGRGPRLRGQRLCHRCLCRPPATSWRVTPPPSSRASCRHTAAPGLTPTANRHGGQLPDCSPVSWSTARSPADNGRALGRHQGRRWRRRLRVDPGGRGSFRSSEAWRPRGIGTDSSDLLDRRFPDAVAALRRCRRHAVALADWRAEREAGTRLGDAYAAAGELATAIGYYIASGENEPVGK